jgi:hypothetical protein
MSNAYVICPIYALFDSLCPIYPYALSMQYLWPMPYLRHMHNQCPTSYLCTFLSLCTIYAQCHNYALCNIFPYAICTIFSLCPISIPIVQTWNARTEGTNGIVMALESDVICQLLEKGMDQSKKGQRRLGHMTPIQEGA